MVRIRIRRQSKRILSATKLGEPSPAQQLNPNTAARGTTVGLGVLEGLADRPSQYCPQEMIRRLLPLPIVNTTVETPTSEHKTTSKFCTQASLHQLTRTEPYERRAHFHTISTL